MYCQNCGNEVGENDKFCEKCGHKIEHDTFENTNKPEEATISNVQKDVLDNNTVNSNVKVTKTRSKKIIFIVAVAVIIIACIFGGISLFNKNTIENKPSYISYTKDNNLIVYDEKNDKQIVINDDYSIYENSNNDISGTDFNVSSKSSFLAYPKDNFGKYYDLYVQPIAKGNDETISKALVDTNVYKNFIVDDQYVFYIKDSDHDESNGFQIAYYDYENDLVTELPDNINAYEFLNDSGIVYYLIDDVLYRSEIGKDNKIIKTGVKAFNVGYENVFFSTEDAFYKQTNLNNPILLSEIIPTDDVKYEYNHIEIVNDNDVYCIKNNNIKDYSLTDFIKDDVNDSSDKMKDLRKEIKNIDIISSKNVIYHYNGNDCTLLDKDRDIYSYLFQNNNTCFYVKLADIINTKLNLSSLIKDVDIYNTDTAIDQIIQNINKVTDEQMSLTGFPYKIMKDNHVISIDKFPIQYFYYHDTGFFCIKGQQNSNESEIYHFNINDGVASTPKFYDRVVFEKDSVFQLFDYSKDDCFYLKDPSSSTSADLYINKNKIDSNVDFGSSEVKKYLYNDIIHLYYHKDFNHDNNTYTLMNYSNNSATEIAKNVVYEKNIEDRIYYISKNENNENELYFFNNNESKLVDSNVGNLW